MATKTVEIDARTPEDIWRVLEGIADQCAKEQYFNALHRLAALQVELLKRQQAINRRLWSPSTTKGDGHEAR